MLMVQAKDINWIDFLSSINNSGCSQTYRWLCGLYPEKVVLEKFNRADKLGYIEYGTSVTMGWITDKGREQLRRFEQEQLQKIFDMFGVKADEDVLK